MDIRKWFYVGVIFIILNLLYCILTIVDGQKSDMAGKGMAHAIGFLGIFFMLIAAVLLWVFKTYEWKIPLILLVILICSPLVYIGTYMARQGFFLRTSAYPDDSFVTGKDMFPGKDGNALARAIVINDEPAIRSLVGSNPPLLNMIGSHNISFLNYAVHLALKYGHSLRPIEVLLELGADPDLWIESGNFMKPINEVFFNMHDSSARVMELLFIHGADPNPVDINGEPLIYWCRDLEKLKLFHKYGSDLNIVNPFWQNTGYTPMMMLASQQAWAAVEYLLLAGADPDVVAPDGANLHAQLLQFRKLNEKYLSTFPEEFIRVEDFFAGR